MIKEVENIILNKEYYELTAEELASVSELVENAEEYEEMKWFLSTTQQALVSDKIVASSKLKKDVLAHLNQPKNERKFWLNSVIPFLFPEDKKFYQKPAFQMSMVAFLLIGFIMFYPSGMNTHQVALNEDVFENDNTSGLINEDEEVENIEEKSVEISESPEEIPVLIEPSFEEENVEVLEIDNIDEISHDGFYSGDLSVEDLKKIENTKINSTTSGTHHLNNESTHMDMNYNATTPIILTENNASLVDDDDKLLDKIEDQKRIKIKGNKKKRLLDANKDRLSKKDEAPIVDEEEDEIVVDQQLNSLGGINEKNNLKEEGKRSNEARDYEEIRSYKLHLNETKELKKLFTVYK